MKPYLSVCQLVSLSVSLSDFLSNPSVKIMSHVVCRRRQVHDSLGKSSWRRCTWVVRQKL